MTLEQLRQLIGMDPTNLSADQKKKMRKAIQAAGLDTQTLHQQIQMISPYVNTHRIISYSSENVPLHSHDYYEILCCRSSCGIEYLVGSHRYLLQKGDIVLIRPGESHRPILPNTLAIPYERDVLCIGKDFMRSIMATLGVFYRVELPTYLLRTAGTPWEKLCDMIQLGVQEEENKLNAWETTVIGNTISFLAQLHRAYHTHTLPSLKAEAPDLLDEIIAYIDDHYQEKIVMDDVGKLFFVSKRSISTLFRKRLGVTFYQFLTQRRLIAAKSMILEGVALESISEQIGFSDYSTFYRVFKSEFGISPREFKKNQEQKPEGIHSVVSNEY